MIEVIISDTGSGMDTGDFSKKPYTVSIKIGELIKVEHSTQDTHEEAVRVANWVCGYLVGVLDNVTCAAIPVVSDNVEPN